MGLQGFHALGCRFNDARCLPVLMHAAPQVIVRMPLPLGSRMELVGPTTLGMVIPRFEFFGVWMQPQVRTHIRYAKPQLLVGHATNVSFGLQGVCVCAQTNLDIISCTTNNHKHRSHVWS